MAIKYVNDCDGKYKVRMTKGQPERPWLLWGDRVEVSSENNGVAIVKARGMSGEMPSSCLNSKRLLEVYVIDVGQGDAVLIRTPDRKWHLIDGGVRNKFQMTRKGAPNFLRWKFIEELGRDQVELENVILSHPDADHYGGLINILAGDSDDGRTFNVSVANFYHPGMGRFASSPKLGTTTSGSVKPPPQPLPSFRESATLITELLSGKTSFRNPSRPFSESFEELADLVGSVPGRVRRLTQEDEYLDGYAPGQNNVRVRVLGPIFEEFTNGTKGLRKYSSESKTRNGHSILLRFDYGNARLLMTGDLNEESQLLLRSYFSDSDFQASVAKGCHHGSEDIDYGFLSAMAAQATVISSGDNEDYSHPRPVVIGASGHYGREVFDIQKKAQAPPLVYSTELARSVKLSYAERVEVDLDPGPGQNLKKVKSENTTIKAKGSGQKYRPLDWTPVATDLIYGLVNVRTDGIRIMCATMEERGGDFDVKVFRA